MRALRRSLWLVSSLVVTATLTSSCAISTTPGDGNGDVTLTFWNYYSDSQLQWLKHQVATFEKDNPGVKIKLVQTVGSQQEQKLLSSVVTGTTPDLFINNIVVDYPMLQSGHVMLDLTPYWNKFADKNKFPPGATWKTDGRIYNVMSYTNLIGMYYNKDILSQYGITTPPKTLDELTADMEKVVAGGKYQGIAMSGAPSVEGAWLFAPQFLGEGVNYCNIAQHKTKVGAAFDRIADWRSKGLLPRAAATWDQNAAWQQFMTGKYAFAFNGNWQLGNAKAATFKYGTTQYPTPPDGTSQVFPGGEGFAIGSKSKHPDLAWKFLSTMIMSPQGGESVYKAAGSIPFNSDAAGIPEIKNDPLVQPFVAATHTTATWPNNPQTATMQTALGTEISAVISGQSTAATATAKAIHDIAAARTKGGGSCR